MTKMFSIFYCACTFNQDIRHWNVSNVQEMRWMFHDAIAIEHVFCPLAWRDEGEHLGLTEGVVDESD